MNTKKVSRGEVAGFLFIFFLLMCVGYAFLRPALIRMNSASACLGVIGIVLIVAPVIAGIDMIKDLSSDSTEHQERKIK